MNKNIFLSEPGVVTSIGCGLAQTMETLLAPKTDMLTPSDFWVKDKTLYFGAVKQPLQSFEEDVPPYFRSRNNQLLYQAVKQIESHIETVINQYGAQDVAVIIGTSTTGIDENIPAFKAHIAGNSWENTNLELRHLEMSSPADFIAWRYQITGLAYGISTACTSSVRALMSAARLLKAGICKAVVCGGVDTLSLLTINGFNSLEVLANGICNPFSRNRDGINIGEGAAVFVMTLDEQTGLPLLGYGASSDAWHMSSPRPDGLGAEICMNAALKQAGLSAQAIGWINLHGTGTQLNDAMESLAMEKIFADQVACTSTKPFTGHTLGAAGAVEAAILWGVISRQYNPQGLLPEHLWDGIEDQNIGKIRYTQSSDRWAKQRIGLSSSFAFGGNNASIIIGE